MRNKTMLAILLSILVFVIVACSEPTAVETPAAVVEEAPAGETDTEEAAPTEEEVVEPAEELVEEEPPAQEPTEEVAEEPTEAEVPAEEAAPVSEAISEEPSGTAAVCDITADIIRMPEGRVESSAEELAEGETEARIFWTIRADSQGIEAVRDDLAADDRFGTIENLIIVPVKENADKVLGMDSLLADPEDVLQAIYDQAGVDESFAEAFADYYDQAAVDIETVRQELLNNLVRKEVEIWEIKDGKPTQVESAVFDDLKVTYVCEGEQALQTEQIVWRDVLWLSQVIHTGALPFANGCYLSVEDPGLSHHAGVLGANLTDEFKASHPVVTEMVTKVAAGTGIEHTQFSSDYYVGENIRLDVTYSAVDTGMNPLFHFPQYYVPDGSKPDGAVIAAEVLGDAGSRLAVWQVRSDGNRPTFDASAPFTQDDKWLVVRHRTEPRDGFGDSGLPYFEFCMDQDGQEIRQPIEDGSMHYFKTGELTFYIGHSPNIASSMFDYGPVALEAISSATGYDFEALRQRSSLHGSIEDLVFDPNASCGFC